MTDHWTLISLEMPAENWAGVELSRQQALATDRSAETIRLPRRFIWGDFEAVLLLGFRCSRQDSHRLWPTPQYLNQSGSIPPKTASIARSASRHEVLGRRDMHLARQQTGKESPSEVDEKDLHARVLCGSVAWSLQ